MAGLKIFLCPVCFSVFETLPQPTERAMCLTCPSISHLSCTVSGERVVRYECRHCQNRNPSLFEFKFDGRRRRGKGEEMDLESAGKLFAAAWIASGSMKKATLAARAEAERRAGEVVVAKRNVKDALERLSSLSNWDAGGDDQNVSGLMRNGQLDGAGSGANGARRQAEDGEKGLAGLMLAGVAGESSRNGNAGSNKKRKH